MVYLDDNPACAHQNWDDETDGPTGNACGKPASWFSCTPIMNQPAREAHSCRCQHPILTRLQSAEARVAAAEHRERAAVIELEDAKRSLAAIKE